MTRITLAAAILAAAVLASGAREPAGNLSPAVREFVRVDAPLISLRHVRVVDGTGAPARDDQTIVVSDGMIQTVGPDGAAAKREGAVEIDLSGATVIPGLVGMHDHLFYPAPSGPAPAAAGSLALYHEMGFSFPRLYLACGVTTIRTTGSIEPQTDLSLSKAVERGEIPGPSIRVTGPYLEGAGSYTPNMLELSGPEDARRPVRHDHHDLPLRVEGDQLRLFMHQDYPPFDFQPAAADDGVEPHTAVEHQLPEHPRPMETPLQVALGRPPLLCAGGPGCRCGVRHPGRTGGCARNR